MAKPILIVRIPNTTPPDRVDEITKNIESKLSNEYFVLVVRQDEIVHPQFEIIK